MESEVNISTIEERLFKDVCSIVEQAKSRVAVNVNAEQNAMFWLIGKRINEDVLDNKRASYGKQIVSTLSTQLQKHYASREYGVRNLRRMMQFAREFQQKEIVSMMTTQLTWSHIVELLPLKDDLQKEFYSTMAIAERWNVKTLRSQMDGMLYERTLISGKPDEMIRKELSDLRDKGCLTPDIVFKSPYFLDFTGLKGYYSEHDLEEMLITGMQQFIMELGNGFTFVDRQKRMIIDGEDFYLDLLFYHRKLHRLIAIELKRTRFKAAYKGQMELYLRWLDKNERQEGEESPLGLLLCTEGGDEQIELLQLDMSGIKVAKYYTELPDKKVLQSQLRRQLESAKKRMEQISEIGLLNEKVEE